MIVVRQQLLLLRCTETGLKGFGSKVKAVTWTSALSRGIEAALPWLSKPEPGTGIVLLTLDSMFFISTDTWTHKQQAHITVYRLKTLGSTCSFTLSWSDRV